MIYSHAEPEQAAQALSALPANRRPSPNRPAANSPLNPASNRPNSPSGRRYSPSQTPQPRPPQSRPVQTNSSHNSYNQNSYHNTSNNSSQSSFNQSSSYNQQPQFQIQPIHSPPPQGYGHGPPPPTPAARLPQQSNRPPRSPAPPPDADSADLYPLFLTANSSQSGTLSESELGRALVNADYTSFDPYTITMMMRMFSSAPHQNFVTYDEFVNLWRFLAAWRELFERFDEDRSGRISLAEFSNALVAFGYRLSSTFTQVLFNTYNEKGHQANQRRGSRPKSDGISFDLFVQACISLKRMTDVFKGYDDDRDGYVTLSFEEFLTEILRLRE